MANDKLALRARETLEANQRATRELIHRAGAARTQKLLSEVERDLKQRLATIRSADDTFTVTQLRATLVQVQALLKTFIPKLRGVVVDTGTEAAEKAAEHAVSYLAQADTAFRGIGTLPLVLRQALLLDAAAEGARSSILRRLASSGEPMKNADVEPHPAKLGVLQRYGVETVGHFERVLQRGIIAKKSWIEMRDDLIEASTFLQGKPAYWAQRIVRTEGMSAMNRAHWEVIREADDQLGDVVKIISSVFDERTGADSYAIHGEIRRPEEAFESWYGMFQHPPDRPNDRGIVVIHRTVWPLPPYLEWRTAEQILKVWQKEGRKGAPPPRPLMTTVELSLFGREEPKKLPAKKEREDDGDERGERPVRDQENEQENDDGGDDDEDAGDE